MSRKAFNLFLRGASIEEISSEINYSYSQTQRFLAAAKKKAAQAFQKSTPEELAGVITSRQEKRLKALWSVYADPKAKLSDRVQALKALREEDDSFFRMLQAIGVFPKEPGVNINTVGATKVELHIDSEPGDAR